MNFLDERLSPRFWSKCIPEPNSGCWLWIGARNNHGYGKTCAHGSRHAYAHRLAYTTLVGDIPPGLVLDHLCRTTCCCNPAHLEPVTFAENVRRGLAGPRSNCVNGHVFDAANTYVRKDTGKRQCIACSRERLRARRKRFAVSQARAA